MTTKNSKLMVVDTCVARACGTGEGEDSKAARQFLNEMKDICHRVILTRALLEEYRKHTPRNRYFTQWMAAMMARKKAPLLEAPEDLPLKQALQSWDAPEERKRIAQKDTLLVNAARVADRIIVSYDNRARQAFAECADATRCPSLTDLVWINPKAESPKGPAVEWLRRGAPAEAQWRLVNKPC